MRGNAARIDALRHGCAPLLLALLSSVAAASGQDPADTNRVYQVGMAAKTIQDAMRDPDSIVFERMLSNDDASVICIAYRARNGFGGMNRSVMTLVKDKASTTPAAWRRHCPGATYDLTYLGPTVKSANR